MPLSAQLQAWREQAETIRCPQSKCHAAPGETCVNPETKQPLAFQAAHMPRLLAAGVEMPPVTEKERKGFPHRMSEHERLRRGREALQASRSADEARRQRAAQRGPTVDLDQIPTQQSEGPEDEQTEADVVWLRGPRRR